MTVTLSVFDTFANGVAGTPEVSDSLSGGGTGVDLGSVTNGAYTDVGNQTNNEGARDMYVRHDAVQDPITDCKTFIQEYLTDLGAPHSYGGPTTSDPTQDFNRIKQMGTDSLNSKNNLPSGDSQGLWVDMDWDVAEINQFDYATNGYDGSSSEGGNDTVSKYGDNTLTWGIGLTNAVPIKADAMSYDAGGVVETSPSAAVDGVIGLNESIGVGTGVTADELADVKGANAHLKLRVYLSSGFADGGIHQFEYVIAYSFTA